MDAAALRGVLADNLRRAAKRKRLRISALADFAGVSRAHLHDVLAGRKSATVDWLAKIADALEVEPAELLSSSSGRPTARRR